MTKKRLGRGLDALLSQPRSQSAPAPQTDEEDVQPSSRGVDLERELAEVLPEQTGAEATIGGDVDVEEIHPSPYQPRRHFDEEALQELAASISRQGLLQPLVVRARVQGGFELIAGERRWRASKLAGMSHVPVVVKNVSDAEASAFALIENMQREDLSALEEAIGLARLRDEFELTQQQIADAVGKSRTAIANLLRLLNLGSMTRSMLEAGDLEMGHARALLGLEGVQQDIAGQQIVEQGMSVRQAEALVRKILAGGAARPKSAAPTKDADTARLEQRLTERLGAVVHIQHAPSGRGELKIKYTSLDELDGVLKHLGET